MAKIWKGHRGESTWGYKYNVECLEEEAAAELGQPKTSAAQLGKLGDPYTWKTSELGELEPSAAEFGELETSTAEDGQLKTSAAENGQLKTSGTSLSSSFDSVTLLQLHRCKSQIKEEEEGSDQPLDLSSSKSKQYFARPSKSTPFSTSSTTWLYSQEEDGGEGSDERDSNTSRSNESPLSERSFSPEVQESPRRGPRLTRDERWMVDQGITEHISLAEVIESDMTELKQRVEGLVQQNRLTEAQASELMHIRKRGKNKNAAKNSRKKKDAEIDDLKKAVKEADRKLKPVAEEEQDLRLALSHWEEKLATLTHFLLISHGMNPDKYKVVIYEDEVLFVLREAMAGHDFGLEC